MEIAIVGAGRAGTAVAVLWQRAGHHIVAVTGYGHAADYDKSRSAGFDTHPVKPVQVDDLLRVLAEGRRQPEAS